MKRKIPQSRIRFTDLAVGKNLIKQRGISNEGSIPLSQSLICCRIASKGSYLLRSAEQSGKERDKGDANEGDTAASHQLLHALGLCLCVIKKQ